MSKKVAAADAELIIQPERSHFHFMLAKNPNYFGNIPGSILKPVLKIISNKTYEEITCVGYNPDTAILEATFSIKRSSGYAGNLCTGGSSEFVRFYIDFHDGNGWIDQGSVAVNVHDIPTTTDCANKLSHPLSYTATLKKKTFKFSSCGSPLLPTMRAILSWNDDPSANSPNWNPVWGNVMDCDIQIKPFMIKFPFDDLALDLDSFFTLAKAAPQLSIAEISDISGVKIDDILPVPNKLTITDLHGKYQKAKIPASRFAYKTVANMIKYPTSELTLMNKMILTDLKLDINSIIDQIGVFFPFEVTEANTDWERLNCVGLDYNSESLVASVQINKNSGYSGDLCDDGSKEYVSFWIDWNNTCEWEYLNTVELNVHDLNMPGDHLCYSVSLPLDSTYHKKICSNPNVVRVRAVLSWNIPPSTTNPNELKTYGNRVDAHIQIKPGVEINPGDVFPLFNIIGGVDVDHVNDASGLTKAGSFFAYNGLSVPTGAPFGGVVVINGPSFPGYRYRIKLTNLDLGTFVYLQDSFTVVGYLPVAPYVQFTTQIPDAAGYYNFLSADKNTLNVLARFIPGTENKFRVDMEVETIAGVFTKTIQMDNTYPVVQLQVDDNGDCTKFSKGDTVTGHYYANDKNISYWSFGSTYGGGASGTSNTPPLPGTAFAIPTNAGSNPCGNISLYAVDKTIVNSQSVGHEVWASYNICLQ